MQRRKTVPVSLGRLTLGGERIYIQSMLNVPSTDILGSVAQAVALEEAGCEILRAAIPDKDAVRLIPAIKERVSIPLVADIHFDYRLALEALEAGVDKIRINPGNIGSPDRIKAVAVACANRGVPIRIGVNSGSVERHILEKYGGPTADALVESGLYNAKLLEEFDDAQDEVKEEQEERLEKLLEEKEKRKLLEKQQADDEEEEDELDKRIEKLFEDRTE